MKTEIENILKSVLPHEFWLNVSERSMLNDNYLCIAFAASDYNINGVSGQRPQCVSLILYIDRLELKPQVFGGNGGQCIYRQPNKELREEKYLCMKSVKIPFRKPLPEKEKILGAVKRFAENYIKTLKENQSVLMYRDIVNYDEILK